MEWITRPKVGDYKICNLVEFNEIWFSENGTNGIRRAAYFRLVKD